jgi:hypothetical protein
LREDERRMRDRQAPLRHSKDTELHLPVEYGMTVVLHSFGP